MNVHVCLQENDKFYLNNISRVNIASWALGMKHQLSHFTFFH